MLSNLVEVVGQYRLVVVSGCQRSGTHIMAKILAHELDWECIPDHDYDADNPDEWANLVLYRQHITIHCPHMTHLLHLVPDDVAVVYMLRPADEIEASFKRVNPGQKSCCSDRQMLFYQTSGISGKVTGKAWTIVRNTYWEFRQRVILGERGYSFQYHDLEEHPLFVKNREGWTMNQTEAGE